MKCTYNSKNRKNSKNRNKMTTPTRTALFQKSTRKNQEFERFLCSGQDAAILDATTSKYIPLTYFVTPQEAETSSQNTSSSSSHPCRTSRRQSHGLADKMPYDTFRLINLQQRGSHAHSLVLFKSRAITTNPEHIAIFECNGQVSQSEIRVLHTSLPPKEYLEADEEEYTDDDDSETTDETTDDTADTITTDADETTTDDDDDDDEDSDEPGTVYDVTELYFSPISPRLCINFGSNRYNPGYCGIFGIIAMVFHRNWQKEPTTWVAEWTQLLNYMRTYIPNEPKCHGSMGTELASKVQEIIASHPSTHAGHQTIEKEIMNLLNEALHTHAQHTHADNE